MLACYHPLTNRVLLALALGLLLALVFLGAKGRRIRDGKSRWKGLAFMLAVTLGACTVLVGLTLWLGSYARSPLGIAEQPALREFVVQKGQGQTLRVESGDGFSISHASLAFITPLIQGGPVSCLWQSQSGAMVDLPDLCDIVYAPPSAEYDVLRVRVRSACGLPDSFGTLRIAILP